MKWAYGEMAATLRLRRSSERSAGSSPAMPTNLIPYLSSEKIDVH